MANRRQLAKVSNTPGRTQLINLFVLPNGATVVDLPGYGYAAVPGRERATWQEMIEGYLLEREPLALVFEFWHQALPESVPFAPYRTSSQHWTRPLLILRARAPCRAPSAADR